MYALARMPRLGRDGPVPWASRSTDLSNHDYFSWGHLINIVYVILVDSDEDLVARISETAAREREIPGIFERVRQSLHRRCHACIATGDAILNIYCHNVTVNGDRYRAMITNFFIPELSNHDVQELWFQQDGATCHTARATIDLLKDTLGDRSLVYADKPQTLDHLEDNIRRVIADIRPQMLEKSHRKQDVQIDYIRASVGSPMPEIIFKISWPASSGGSPKVISRLWNQFQTSGTVTMKVGQGRHKVSTSPQDRYLALSPRRHKGTTMFQLARDLVAVSGRRISRQTRCSFDCFKQERPSVEELKASVVDTIRMGVCSFQ
ncbi:uncharacterized protein TNCV_4841451 [Trichonephila clavipes]|uniref:Transposase n=1 Tax=Trichonephila clavipes TaxID=2585209 RepID=A0A8X6WIN3_TRICX|nr:uncharacterized protein TNCV_4841451 [Trichonephila clavipes]